MLINQILSRLSDDKIKFIASLDYGADKDKHFQALQNVISRGGNVIMESEYWFPYEVIELGSYSLVGNHQREFIACISIVAHNIKTGVDKNKVLDEFISDRIDAISSLDPIFRNEILTNLELE